MKSIKTMAAVLSVALTGAFLSALPANAAVPTIAVSINGTPVTTAASSVTPASVTVPSDNSVDAADAVKFELTGVDTGTTVSVSAINALVVPALATVAIPVTASAGATTWSVNVGTGTTATFYAFTKTTATGAVTITNGGNAFTYYLKGTAGPAYNLAFAPAVTANTSASAKVVAKVTDAFGNAVAGVTPVASSVNLTVGAIVATDAKGETEVLLTFPALAGKSAVSLAITATDVVGLPAAAKTITTFIEVADLAALLAAEKAGRAADKELADKALALAKAEAAAALAEEKAKAAEALRVAAEKAAADVKAANDKAAADKATADKAIADLTAQVTAFSKALADLKKAYNKMAKKFKFPTVK